MIYVIGPRDKVPADVVVMDVTSRVSSPFSPFLNPTTDPIKAIKMENAWQYTKVYPEHDDNGEPNSSWYTWRDNGLKSKWANRYPMGKGAIPLYSYHNGVKYGYIEARSALYEPLYRSMLKQIPKEIDKIVSLAMQKDIALWDFDGYNDPGKTYQEILNDSSKKMGHAFVLREVLLEKMAVIYEDSKI